jgi:hypothetical protein
MIKQAIEKREFEIGDDLYSVEIIDVGGHLFTIAYKGESVLGAEYGMFDALDFIYEHAMTLDGNEVPSSAIVWGIANGYPFEKIVAPEVMSYVFVIDGKTYVYEFLHYASEGSAMYYVSEVK